MGVVLLGDSHLARVRRGLAVIGPDVRNHAVGGATSRDLAGQLATAAPEPDDVLVVSVGTNDAAPWHAVPVAEVTSTLARLWAPRRWVCVAPPGVVESLVPQGSWTNAVVDDHRAAVIRAARACGVDVVRADLVLAPLGPAAFANDGVHLSGAGYGVLLPAVANAVAAIVRTP